MIKKHPEWSEKYPAIDGIAKGERPSKEERKKMIQENPTANIHYRQAEKPIRSDIEKILKLNDEEFNTWFAERRIAALNLLNNYELIGSIPSLRYSSEEQQNGLKSNSMINGPINVLKDGIEYLGVIRQVRNEYKQIKK